MRPRVSHWQNIKYIFLLICILLHTSACSNADRFGFLQSNLSEAKIALEETLQFADDNISLELGSTTDLSSSVALRSASNTKNDIVWFINNNSILESTAPNTFFAKALGTTTLKASAGPLAKTITVSVIEPKQDLSDISFANTLGVLTNSKPGQLLFNYTDTLASFGSLSAAVLQTHLPCALQFTSDAPAILTVDANGIFTPLQNGFATLSVSCGNDLLSQDVSVEAFHTPQDTTSPNSNDGNTSETLRTVTFHFDPSYQMDEQVLLKADLHFDSGTVNNVTSNFITPLGQTGKITWGASTGATISNGVIAFSRYGKTDIALFFGRQSFVESVNVMMASEEPTDYMDRFLGYDDFPGYESWTSGTCPVVDFGSNGGYAKHLCPEIIMNQPFGNLHVVSIGSGGEITLEINGFYPVDADGPDFTIFENPLLSDENDVFAERAQVSVSQNGTTFYDFDCDAFDADNHYPGCAGVNLVNIDADFLDTADSGGDSYDLADLGLSYIRYIRITDMQTCVAGDPTFDSAEGWELCNASGKEGFDLDALVILNGARE